MKGSIMFLVLFAALMLRSATAQRTVANLNMGWKFVPNVGGGGGGGQNCTDLNATFPQDFSNKQCQGVNILIYKIYL